MCLFQSTARRLVSQVHCGLKASSSKKQKFCLEMARPSSNMADFREVFAKAKHIAIITGAGVSAESGVPTFRGAGGFWRKWQAQELATPGAFARNPSRVWEFYHYRREVMLSKHPNPAHIAIAECEKRLSKQGRSVVVITQNIDELHRKAGTKHLLEIHGLQILTQKMLPFQLKTFLSVRRTAAMGSCGPTWCGLAKPWIPACSQRWRRSWIFVTSAWSSGPRPWCILRPCSPRRSRPEESRSRSSTWKPLLPPTGSGSTSRAPAGPRCRRRWRDTRQRSSPEPWDHPRSAGSGPGRRDAARGGRAGGGGGTRPYGNKGGAAGPSPMCCVCARIPRGGAGLGGRPGARHSPAEGGSGSGADGAGAAAMARRRKAKAAAAGKRKALAALPSPASSSEDEAPEEVSFGVAREAAEAERKLVGEAARRHRELLKEKRRRHQELFAEQKKRRLLPEAVLQELQELQELQDVSARPAEQAAADDPVTLGEELEAEAVELEQGQAQRQGQAEVQEKKGKRSKGARTKGNYVAVCLKDHSATGLHQQLARDFLNAQLYGPHTNRVPANEFFSLANKRGPVKKAAVHFVDKSWGQDKKEKAARFKNRWLATHIKNGV